MHMSDALLSPAVGGVMTAVAACAVGYSVKRVTGEGFDERKIPMMGVLGAFVFAGQMVNFTIPGTGSSGHIGGGILLAALLGPYPALLTLAAVLLIQCLFFADGGLLAYGCNVFNIGFCACLLAYRFVYRPIIKQGPTRRRIVLASVLAAVLGLQLGSFCVVLQTTVSGVAELPFAAFALLMQPIHLAIGLVEGLVTAAVLLFVYGARPELLRDAAAPAGTGGMMPKRVLAAFAILALVTGGGLSLFASSHPDGLEWSIEGTAGTAELERVGAVHNTLGAIADSTAILPDYTFPHEEEASALGTAASGIMGSAITVALAGGVGLAMAALRKRASASKAGDA